ncbi:MAG: histidine phosphatase family protein [Casimicrobiaceae bacterium]
MRGGIAATTGAMLRCDLGRYHARSPPLCSATLNRLLGADYKPGNAATESRLNNKTFLCIRHAESTFNAAWRDTEVDPLHFDAPLSAIGMEQVAQARSTLVHLPVELVITSPLSRALQTTAGLFADHPSSPEMLVVPLSRERVENSCDVGRSPAELATRFAAFDFGHLSDIWWHVDEAPDVRGVCVEPLEAVAARAAEFKTLLLSRPERFIAVVSHGTFLFYLTGRRFANCEAVELTLS